MKNLTTALFFVVATSAFAATVTWDGGGNPDRKWDNALNWNTDTLPVSGVDSLSLNLVNTSSFLNNNINFVLASGQSIVTTQNLALRWQNGGLITLQSGSNFDLTNGGSQTSSISNNFGYLLDGDDGLIFDAGASARVSSFDGVDNNFLLSFNTDALGAITTFQVDNAFTRFTDVDLAVDLSAMTLVGGETFVLVDYGSIDSSTFGTETITGLGSFSYNIDYAYDIGGGDLGVALKIIPEPSSFALLAGLVSIVFIMISRRK